MFHRCLCTILKQSRPILKSRQCLRSATLFMSLAHCTTNSRSETIKFDRETLDHEFLIKQATTVNVNAATQLLTVTMVAIQESSEKLRQYLVEEMKLYKQAQDLGIAVLSSNHWDNLIVIRSTIEDLKHNLNTLFSYMEYAERIATTAAEISFLSGNTTASDAICQRIQQANSVCSQNKSENSNMIQECLDLQRQVIENTPQLEEIFETPTITENK